MGDKPFTIGRISNPRYGTVADIRLRNGRVYRARWDFVGRVCAWWPEGNRRRRPIGSYEPVAYRVIAVGFEEDWEKAHARAMERLRREYSAAV